MKKLGRQWRKKPVEDMRHLGTKRPGTLSHLLFKVHVFYKRQNDFPNQTIIQCNWGFTKQYLTDKRLAGELSNQTRFLLQEPLKICTFFLVLCTKLCGWVGIKIPLESVHCSGQSPKKLFLLVPFLTLTSFLIVVMLKREM